MSCLIWPNKVILRSVCCASALLGLTVLLGCSRQRGVAQGVRGAGEVGRELWGLEPSLLPRHPRPARDGSHMQRGRDTHAPLPPLSPELSFFISFFVGLSDFGGFLNALLVLYFQHYWHVIRTRVLPLGALAQACTCWLQKCLSKGKTIRLCDLGGFGCRGRRTNPDPRG